LSATATQLPPDYPSLLYEPCRKKIWQGDIALCEFHQLRARSSELSGPGPDNLANEDLPYFGPWQDFEIHVPLPGPSDEEAQTLGTRVVERRLRVWTGPAIVLHQNCELDYADANDSRISVAPIVSRPRWPNGPWKQISGGELPNYLYLPSMDDETQATLRLSKPWPESAVAFASITGLSKGIVGPNRLFRLSDAMIPHLQSQLVRATTVRGWGSTRELDMLRGRRIIKAEETAETVRGPSRLAKIFLEGEEGSEELTVTWGLRRSSRPN
jgi:hypothetical protein